MSLSSEMTAAAAEAQGVLAEIGGMASGAEGNFTGPDGKPYTMVFRTADAFESSQATGLNMASHGYNDQSIVIATATRDQFSAVPIGWRAQHGTRLVPNPAQDCVISTVATDDPYHFVFTLIFKQATLPNG